MEEIRNSEANNVLRLAMASGYTSHGQSQNGCSRKLKKILELYEGFPSFLLIFQNTLEGFLCGVPAAYKSRNIFPGPSGFLQFLKLVVKTLSDLWVIERPQAGATGASRCSRR